MPEYSISQLGTFEQCALQYKFIYVDRIDRKEEGVEAFLGQRFHDAMEWLYGEKAFRVVPLEELLDHYEKDWAAQWYDEVKINKPGRTQDDYRLMGRRFIEDLLVVPLTIHPNRRPTQFLHRRNGTVARRPIPVVIRPHHRNPDRLPFQSQLFL